MKLSIIIPVYNVEKYLTKCLDSCLNQNVSDDDYEIIVVNDGSPDGSRKIIANYEQINNVKVIDQSNQGLSMARNNGLEIAKGKYVWFIDSDDWIESNCLRHMIDCFKDSPDLVQIGYKESFESSGEIGNIVCDNKPLNNGKHILIEGGLPTAAQFTIYRRSFLNKYNLRFLAGILHEDTEFKPRATYFAQKIVFYPHAVYNYLLRSTGSITSSYKLKNVRDQLIVNKSLKNFMNKYVHEKDVQCAFRSLISMNLNSILAGLKFINGHDYKVAVELIRENTWIFNEMLKSGKIKYMLEAIFFKSNLRAAIKLHSVLKV